jgi:hypothetical protein
MLRSLPLAVLALIAAFACSDESELTPTSVVMSSAPPTISASPAASESPVTWKTFTDPLYAFSISYPVDWYTTSVIKSATGDRVVITDYDPEKNRPTGGRYLRLSIEPLGDSETEQAWLDSLNSKSLCAIEVLESRGMSIGGREGVQQWLAVNPVGDECMAGVRFEIVAAAVKMGNQILYMQVFPGSAIDEEPMASVARSLEIP